MGSSLIDGLFVFMLAGFIGFEVIKRISPLLHTPLMSITNALDAIAVVGAIVLVGKHESRLSFILGILAVIALSARSIRWVSCDGIVQFSLFLRFFLLLLLQLFSALFS